jgi:hypothetical protein
MTQVAIEETTVARTKKVKPQLSDAERRILQKLLEQPPRYEEILLSALQIDLSYQDRPREKLVNQIAEYFSPAMVQTPIVSRRPDNSLFVADGATRKLGMEKRGLGKSRIRCQVFDTNGPKQEALLFKHFNASRRAVPLGNRLTAEGIGGVDKGLLKTVQATGYSLAGSSKDALRGPGFVKKAFEIDPESMQKALFALRASWGPKYGRINGITVLGLTMFYATIRNCDAAIRKWLKTHTPDDLQDVVYKCYGGGHRLTQEAKLRPNHLPWWVAKGIGLAINRRSNTKLNLAPLDAKKEMWQIVQAHPED